MYAFIAKWYNFNSNCMVVKSIFHIGFYIIRREKFWFNGIAVYLNYLSKIFGLFRYFDEIPIISIILF